MTSFIHKITIYGLTLSILTFTMYASASESTPVQPEAQAIQPEVQAIQAEATPILPEATQASLEQQWGIRVLSLRQTASGYMLDFRYRVIDPEKAKQVLNRKIKPQLIVSKSGNRLQVPSSPKLGPMRQITRAPRADTNYFIFFANPRRQVKTGDSVSIQVGKLEISGLKVTSS